MLGRILLIALWSLLFYLGSAFVLGFAAGMLFMGLAAANVQGSHHDAIVQIIARTGYFLPAVCGLVGLVLAVFGKLPWTATAVANTTDDA